MEQKSPASLRTQIIVVLGFCFGTIALIVGPLLYEKWRQPYRDEVAFLSRVLRSTNTTDNLSSDFALIEQAAQMLASSHRLSHSESNAYNAALQTKRSFHRARCRASLHQNLTKLARGIELREWTVVDALLPELRSFIASFEECGENRMAAQAAVLVTKLEEFVLAKAGVRPTITLINAPSDYRARKLSELDIQEFFRAKLHACGLLLVDTPQAPRSLIVRYEEIPDTTDTYTLRYTYEDRRPESYPTKLSPVQLYCGFELRRPDGSVATRHDLRASSPTQAGESRDLLHKPREEIQRQINGAPIAMSSDPATATEIQPHIDAIQTLLNAFPLSNDSSPPPAS